MERIQIACGLFTGILLLDLLPAIPVFCWKVSVFHRSFLCVTTGESKTMLPGITLAIFSTIGFLGFLTDPPVIGYVAQAHNLKWSIGFTGTTGIFTGLIAIRLNRLQ